MVLLDSRGNEVFSCGSNARLDRLSPFAALICTHENEVFEACAMHRRGIKLPRMTICELQTHNSVREGVISALDVCHPCYFQVDVENETMRMREGWKVWLLPNQATGRQGVPRYIKVDPSSISEAPTGGAGLEESAVHSMHDVGATECNETNVEANGARVRAGETTEAEHGQTANESSEVASHSEGEEETENSPSPASAVKKTTGVSRRVGGKRALTPTAPAWTPSGACKGSAEEQTPGPVDSIHAIVEDHISGSMRSDNSEVATETPMEHDSMPEHLKESDPAPQDSKGSEPTSQDPKKIDVAPEVPNGNDSTPQESKESDSMPPHSPDDPQDERNIEGVLCKNGPKTISSESSA